MDNGVARERSRLQAGGCGGAVEEMRRVCQVRNLQQGQLFTFPFIESCSLKRMKRHALGEEKVL